MVIYLKFSARRLPLFHLSVILTSFHYASVVFNNLPLLTIHLFLNPVASLPLPSPAPLAATTQHSYLNSIPASSFLLIHHASPHHSTTVNIRRSILFTSLPSKEMLKSTQVQTPPPHVAHPGSLTKHLLSTLSISGPC